jgi:catechol-2,3-dioxygenase
VSADTEGMPVRLHHIVVDTCDLPRLARFWAQALGWRILSEREREIVIGTDDSAPVGMCFMPVTDPTRSASPYRTVTNK